MKLAQSLGTITFGIGLLFGAAGCATLNNQGSQTLIAKAGDQRTGVKIEVVTADGSYLSSLPSTVVGRSSWTGIEIKVIDPCYDATSFAVPKSLHRAFWANLFFIYGFLIDPATGYLWDYEDRVEVPVRRKASCGA